MTWAVEHTDEFENWWTTLDDGAQVDIAACVRLLEEQGPTLRFPYSSGIASSRHEHMRELRVQHGGDPIRILYAFNPLRTAILLLGGHKGGNDRWYDENVPKADALYDVHLAELRAEGLLK